MLVIGDPRVGSSIIPAALLVREPPALRPRRRRDEGRAEGAELTVRRRCARRSSPPSR